MLRGNVCEFMPEGWMICPPCDGSGENKEGKRCGDCEGVGRMPDPTSSLFQDGSESGTPFFDASPQY